MHINKSKSQFLISNLTKSDLNSIVKFKFQLKNLRHLRRYLNFKFELKFEKKDKELAISHQFYPQATPVRGLEPKNFKKDLPRWL